MASQKPSWGRAIGRFLGRSLAAAFVAAALLAAGGAFWLQRNLSPERLRPMIVNQLERTFQRRIDIQSVSVALHQGVRVTGLVVYSQPGAPQPVFLSAEVMIVKYSLPALLQGRFVLSLVRLVNPRVALYRKADGLWNLEEMLLSSRGAREGTGLSLPPLSAADEIRLEDGVVRLVDKAHGLDTTLGGVFFSVDDFSLDKPFPCRLKLAGKGTFRGKSHALRLEADLELMLAALRADERTGLAVRRLKAEVDGRVFEATGRVRNLLLPDFDAKGSFPALTSADLRELGFAASDGWAMPAGTWDLRVRTTPVSTSSPTPAAYFVDGLTLSAGPWKLEASGRLGAADRRLSGTVRTTAAPLERAGELYAPWSEHDLTGSLDAVVSLGGTSDAPKTTQWSLDMKGFAFKFWNGKRFSDSDITIRAQEGFKNAAIRVSRGSYIAYSNVLSELDAEVRFSGADLVVPRLNLTWNGSRVKLKGCVREVKTWGRVAVDAEVDRLRVDETYTAVENLIAQRMAELGRTPQKDRPWASTLRLAIPERFPDMIGRLRVSEIASPNFRAQNLDLSWSLQGIARELKTVNGHFQAGFGPGNLRNISELQKAHPLVNVLLIPYVEMHKIRQKSRGSFETAVPTTLDFTRMFGDFSAGAGVVGVNFIHFDSQPFQAYTAGTADFPKETVDLNVIMRMTESAQNLPYSMVDDQGRLALDVSLVKDLNKPEVVFRGRKVGSRDIEKGLDEGLKRTRPMPDLAEAVACGRGG
ncbi:MAG: hypothetical protein HYZ75_14505 [Elusimicrobia bacterium]|nr:hypothetical protein [Elusimicrobiota bacterium]